MFITILFLEQNPHGIKILVIPKKATVLLDHFSHHLRVLKGGGGSPKNDMMTRGGGGICITPKMMSWLYLKGSWRLYTSKSEVV